MLLTDTALVALRRQFVDVYGIDAVREALDRIERQDADALANARLEEIDLQPPMYRFLTIEHDRVVCKSRPLAADVGAEFTDYRLIDTVEEVDALTRPQDVVMCSSSLDFPKEHTGRVSTLRLCRDLRGRK